MPAPLNAPHRFFAKISPVFLAFFAFAGFMAASQLAAQVLDLEKLAKSGLPESVRERMVVQSLSQRARPPLEGEFLLEMVRYGGEGLALKYMSLDSATANEAEAPLSPAVMSRLMKSGTPRADLEKIVEIAGGVAEVDSKPVPVPPALVKVSEVTVTDLPPVKNQAQAENPLVESPVASPKSPKTPEYVPAPVINRPPTREELRKIPQTLIPGVPADPARPMPPSPGPYQIRRPEGSRGVYMGVQEEVKPDGHVYQTNLNGRKEYLGSEVLSRPSGHKIHRYYSGKTDRTRPDYPQRGGYPAGPDYGYGNDEGEYYE
jgi:hypothetical protein